MVEKFSKLSTFNHNEFHRNNHDFYNNFPIFNKKINFKERFNVRRSLNFDFNFNRITSINFDTIITDGGSEI